MSLLIRTCAVVLLALAGLLPGRESSAQGSALRGSDLHILRVASLSLAHQSRASTIRWLERQPAVESAGLAVDRKTIEIHFQDGSRSAILPREMTTTRLTLPVFRPHTRLRSSTHDSIRRAIVMEPFATEQLGPSAGVAQVRALTASGLQVTALYDKQVTIDSMK